MKVSIGVVSAEGWDEGKGQLVEGPGALDKGERWAAPRSAASVPFWAVGCSIQTICPEQNLGHF